MIETSREQSALPDAPHAGASSVQVSDGLGPRDFYPEELDAIARERKKRRVSAVVVLLLAPGFIVSPFWLSSKRKKRSAGTATCERIEDHCAARCSPALKGQVPGERLGPRAFEICLESCVPATCH